MRVDWIIHVDWLVINAFIWNYRPIQVILLVARGEFCGLNEVNLDLSCVEML